MAHLFAKEMLHKVQRRLDFSSCDDVQVDSPVLSTPASFFTPKVFQSTKATNCHLISPSCSPLALENDTQPDSGAGCAFSSPISIPRTKCYFPNHPVKSSPHNFTCIPPIGVFWDIENCSVPRGRSAIAVVQIIRDKFFSGYREADFVVVCDVKKENNQIIQELNDAQVSLIHVAATCKNAADEKLRLSLRRFADLHGSPAAIVLISGDVNFAADINDLRHRKKIHVILLHNENVSEALLVCANENHNFSKLTETLPLRSTSKNTSKPAELVVTNLPENVEQGRIRNRLKQLSDNCGGKVGYISGGAATIRFSNWDFAARAQKRMNGEDVFGNQISVGSPITVEEKRESPLKSQPAAKKAVLKQVCLNENMAYHATQLKPCSSVPSNMYSSIPSGLNINGRNQLIDSWSDPSQENYPFWQIRDLNAAVHPINGCSREPHISLTDWKEHSSKHQTYHGISNIVGPRSKSIGSYQFQPAGTYGTRCRSPSPLLTSSKNRNGPNHIQKPSARKPGQVQADDKLNKIKQQKPLKKVNQNADSGPGESEHYFHPIQNSAAAVSNTSASTPIELHVTNLDKSLGAKEAMKVVTNLFKEYVPVLHVSVTHQSDGYLGTFVKVPSLSDAQYAISMLHKRKVGFRRINISYASTGGPSPQVIRSQVISVLLDVPGHSLPLFQFRELYENRFMASISASDLYKLKDVCEIIEDGSYKLITLHPNHRNTPSPYTVLNSEDVPLDLPFCPKHCSKLDPEKGWAEQETAALPNLRISLKEFKVHIYSLLQSHQGSIPLLSLPFCYKAQFKSMEEDENGVPLEHLLSCIPTVEIAEGDGGVEYLRWSKNKSDSNQGVSTQNSALTLFSREMVELIKTFPHCQLLFNRFIPAYHQHFGRQCRVADYGFIKLVQLLKALPNVVQVVGKRDKRIITLSHQVQIQRFTSDLLKILKSQTSKQVLYSEFPSLYERILGRPWDPVDYGLCELEDLLAEVPENTVVVSLIGNDFVVSIRKRDQTVEEMEKTKKFAEEVIELLSHAPQCSMLFNKFVPAYHHHFGHQCRVADYGFTKLKELFEAIPDIVKILDLKNGERLITLTMPESLKVLRQQILTIMSNKTHMNLEELRSLYIQQFGFGIRPESFECTTLKEVALLLSDIITVEQSSFGIFVRLKDKDSFFRLGLQVRRVLMESPGCILEFKAFQQAFKKYYQEEANMDDILKHLSNVVEVIQKNNKSFLQLTPLQQFAHKVYQLLCEAGGSLPFRMLDSCFISKFGTSCNHLQYGFPNTTALLQAIPETVTLLGKKNKVVLLNRDLQDVGITLPPEVCTYPDLPANDTKLTLGTNNNDENVTKGKVSTTPPPPERHQEADIFNLSPNAFFNKMCNGSRLLEQSEAQTCESPKKVLAVETRETTKPMHAPIGWKTMEQWTWSPPKFPPCCVNTPFSPYKPEIYASGGNWPLKEEQSAPSNAVPAEVVAPDPSELPLPLLGINPESRTTPNNLRRKRLAAHFISTPNE